MRAGQDSRRPRPRGRGGRELERRAHVRDQHRLRPLRLEDDPAGAVRGAPAPPAAQPRVRRGGAVSGRGRPRGHAPAREHARQGDVGDRARDGGAAPRVPEPRRAPAGPEPRVGRRVRATSRRSRTSRFRSSARASRPSRASCSPVTRLSRAWASNRSRLRAKEGLSLINGTQFMSAMGALGCVRARRLAAAADIACALSLEALQGSKVAFRPEIQALRPFPGQIDSAANVLRLVDGSAIIEAHRWCDKVQDAYSLRCAPQVHGASRDLIAYAEGVVAIEVNAATDNPLVFVESRELVSNGNFHGQPVAYALDTMKIAVTELAIDLRAARRAADEPVALGRPAGVPHAGRRAQLRVHDPPVRGRIARQRRTRCSRIPRASTRSRRAPARRITSPWGTPPGSRTGRCSRTAERALAIELLAAAQGDRVPRAARAGRGDARGARAIRALSAAVVEDRSISRATSSASPRRSATVRSARRSRQRSESSHERRDARRDWSSELCRRPRARSGRRAAPS